MARTDIYHGGWRGIERGREYEGRVLRAGMCRVRRRGGELTIVMIFHVMDVQTNYYYVVRDPSHLNVGVSIVPKVISVDAVSCSPLQLLV